MDASLRGEHVISRKVRHRHNVRGEQPRASECELADCSTAQLAGPQRRALQAGGRGESSAFPRVLSKT
jgi:hypothetical protein